MKIVIVGGVAGGASAAARARRVNANAEILLLEKGANISFANCGMPYHIGGEIAQRDKLLVATPDLFWKRFRVHVKTRHQAIAIDRSRKVVVVKDLAAGTTFEQPYDRLILSTGSEPKLPEVCQPMPKNAFHLWTLSDMDHILQFIANHHPKSAVILGGGFVGLEALEQLHRLGMKVSLIERNPQVLKLLDVEMATVIQKHMESVGVQLLLDRGIQRLEQAEGIAKTIHLADGTEVPCELLIVATGIRPRTELAEQAGLELGPTQGVLVNDYMQTSDPNIYAVGDIAEVVHGVLDERMRIPLAGPANRAGRVAGEHAATGRSAKMGKVLGTTIVRVFDLAAACTGLNESQLRSRKLAYRSVIIQAPSHASYYPGAKSMQLKLLYAPETGRILGGQAIGGDGVDKRIDVIATAMHFGGTVRELAEVDLTYAPPFGSAKDPVHMAAFAACNDLDGMPNLAPPDAELEGLQVVDVRTAKEREALPLFGAIGIEIDELPDRWQELNPSQPTIVVCHSGKRAHVGACLLQGKGFQNVSNLSGGMSIRSLIKPRGE